MYLHQVLQPLKKKISLISLINWKLSSPNGKQIINIKQFYDGNNQNVDDSKIALPSNLYSNIADEISNLDIIAFDSFDGADFIIKGDKIFDTDKKKQVKEFVYGNMNTTNQIQL